MNSILMVLLAIGQTPYAASTCAPQFPLVQGQTAATLMSIPPTGPSDSAVGDFQTDVERVTNRKPAITGDNKALKRNMGSGRLERAKPSVSS
jgi:hypothetical protein